MVARIHHYVPQWLQRRFTRGERKYFYRDCAPITLPGSTGQRFTPDHTCFSSPKKCFQVLDLYSVNFPGKQTDVVEVELFGQVDDQGAKAIEYFASGEFAPSNSYYGWFLRFLSVQKMRTPKGLAWLKSFGNYVWGKMDTPEALMLALRAIAEMHVTSWAECVWEVVEAPEGNAGFLLTDHPVTAYNLLAPPGSKYTGFPLDPVIELLGTRTIFPLDSKRCLILSNQEFVENPDPQTAFEPRTNARAFGFTVFTPLQVSRGRVLSTSEVWSINLILKSRAIRFIAAPDETWLSPEDHCSACDWEGFDKALRPRKDVRRIKEVWAERSDGSKFAIDRLGQRITDEKRIHEMEEFDRMLAARRSRE